MTDALYYSVDNNTINLLRFYSTGDVIGVPVVSSIDGINKILSWFKIEKYNSNWSKGTYVFNGKNLQFELRSGVGLVAYSGEIQKDKSLTLNVYSHVNGNKSIRYYKKYSGNEDIIINSTNTNLLSSKEFSQDYTPKESLPNGGRLTAETKPKSNFWTYVFIMLFLSGCVTCATRKREGCKCWDGSNSYAVGSGACSHHGGVMYWKHHYWWDN